jgi:hemolysin activation/secretion protein
MKPCFSLAAAFSLIFLSLQGIEDCPSPRKESQRKGPPLQGIVLLGPENSVYHLGLSCHHGLTIEGLCLPMPKEKLEEIFPWDAPLDKESIGEVQKNLILSYQKAGRSVVVVEIPPQDLTAGVLQLRVIEGKLGEVVSKGNRWYGDRVYTRGIHLERGEPIDEKKLLDNVALLNRSPFHRTQVIYSPGSSEGTANIELYNRDRFPLRIYAGGDNTGTREIDRARFWAGFDWGCAYLLDQVFSYQYCASPNFSEFQSHTFRYTATLPWGHILFLYGGFSTVNPKIPEFESDGVSGQGSLRYQIPIPTLYENWLMDLILGFDGKSANNNLNFLGAGDIFILKQTANLSQLVFGYDIGWQVPKHRWDLSFLAFYSPGRMLPNEQDAKLQEFRTGARNQYLYAKATSTYQYTIPEWFSLYFQGRAQKSSRPLLPSEQFSIGGYDTVRGFDERLFNGDDGVIGNGEIRTAEYPLLGLYRKGRIEDRISGHLFFDCGYAHLIESIVDEPRNAYLSSIGAGMRYSIGEWLSFRLDWGFKIHNAPVLADTSLGKLHLGLLVGY